MKIYVDSEELKQELLEQSKYIHDFMVMINNNDEDNYMFGLNSDKAGILMHLYLNSDMIIVDKNK